ncbi:MAG: xanthine dehydrogenase family protein subunit M [Desulfobulbus sp.]|nr:xanthine dehydrogenase family protein subunit M [Desulfobulbus sp.]
MRTVLTPSCLEEFFVLLEQYPEALPIAGGTDLLIRLRNVIEPDNRPLLALNAIPEVHGIREESETLSIGAAVTFSGIINDPLIREQVPVLALAARKVGGPAIRNMATIGGNICTASPAGDSLPPLYVLGAKVEIAARQGIRRMPIEKFILGPGQISLGVGEIVTRIQLPHHACFPWQTFEKVGRRRSLAIAVTSFAGQVRLAIDGTIAEARFAWGSVAPTVKRLPALEQELVGARLESETLRHAAAMVRSGVSPIDDIRATAHYRRTVAGNVLVRFLEGLRA